MSVCHFWVWVVNYLENPQADKMILLVSVKLDICMKVQNIALLFLVKPLHLDADVRFLFVQGGTYTTSKSVHIYSFKMRFSKSETGKKSVSL